MALKAGRVGVAPSEVDQQGKVTAGGMTPEQNAKLDRALLSPVTAPTEKEVVGVGTANDQIMVKIGDGLVLDGETSPYTLKASGVGGGGFGDDVNVGLSGFPFTPENDGFLLLQIIANTKGDYLQFDVTSDSEYIARNKIPASSDLYQMFTTTLPVKAGNIYELANQHNIDTSNTKITFIPFG